MPNADIIEVDSTGKITGINTKPIWSLRVSSGDYAPFGNVPKGSEAFIIDLQDVAFFDGTKWYGSKDGNAVSITAGQTWAELFA